MKLNKLLKILDKLPEEAQNADVIYSADETGTEIDSVYYDEKLNVVFICDEIENK